VFFQASTLRRLGLPAALCCSLAASGAVRVDFTIDGLEAPAFSAKAIRLQAGEGAPAEFTIGELALYGRTWRNVRVACKRLDFGRESIECAEGRADIGASMPLSFTYSTRQDRLALVLYPAKGETWRFDARFGRERRLDLSVENGALSHVAGWMPADQPKFTSGTVSGTVTYSETRKTGSAAAARLELRGVSFADASGLHAGEKLDFDVKIDAEQPQSEWRWRADLDWKSGEVYWQPLYLRGAGHTASGEGTFDDDRIRVTRARVALAGVGAAEGQAEWDRRKGVLTAAEFRSGRLDASALYTEVAKPFLFDTAFSDMQVTGATEVTARWKNSELEALDVQVSDLSLQDKFRRFAVSGANGRVPWHHQQETQLDLELKGGEILKVPFGPVRLPLTMQGKRFRLKSVDLPLLDGKLTMRAFASDPPDDDWRWGFRGTLSAISMERLTRALELPVMHGTLAADIPRVIYAKSTLQLGGTLVFRVFDGTVEAKNVQLIDPFGKVPRLLADVEARNIDLDLLTRTYSVGNMKGRIDADVKGLELSDWHAVRFDLRIASSPGSYPRKISQKAVENITALGGASAAAAVQRLFLRFFDQFDYDKLGWSCRLEKGVCHMGGVENTAQGYVIVKGDSIPRLDVLGYNRDVNWDVLLERVKRVVQDNVRAVVQ
jgi:hypothetical protein